MAAKIKPLIPPDESMWQKYSPHFEFPLATATSLFLHGTIIGILAIGGIAFFFAGNLEATRPPRMDVVMLEGGGVGLEGLGSEPGLPGNLSAGATKTEQINPLPETTQPDQRPLIRPETLPQLSLPLIEVSSASPGSNLVIELQKTLQEADDLVKKEMKIPQTPSGTGEPKKLGPIGTGNPKGRGGLGGSGSGSGGNKQGAGTVTGGAGGRKATDQEIKASRWRFDLSGDAKEHARKLAAIGFTVALPDPRGGFILVTDLNRRPVDMKKSDLAAFKDAVKWYNTRPESVQALAHELQLPFEPKFVVLLLPKEREAKMAGEEARFAEEQRRNLKTVQATWFDFRLRNGSYDPAVIRQE